ncbi:hypothetical protein [Microbacterium sulfonylureivorans]|uniref:hypothetical protein n=1 Tax=Microbacterium sulfonylureivorans TaxID=2486854 RepID=UPI000FDAFD90|nr:hypothetical protein [Microbacterium sulfonylureivorans]
MPKQLVTIIGLVVSLGVVAVGVALVALPMWMQSLAVDGETATVADTNALYQAQVDTLETEADRQGEIDASVAALRTEIPAANQLDDVFEVVGRAADTAGVTITSATAGESAAFVARTAASAPGEEPVAVPAPAPEDGTDGAAAEGEATEAAEGVATDAGTVIDEGADAPLTGRQQVDFTIAVTANDMAQVTRFLDALRAGPRLLAGITATTTLTGTAVEVQVSALTFVDSEG